MPYSEASKRATIKYQCTHLKRIPLSVKTEEYERIKAAADRAGESVNGYIKNAIRQRMERDGATVDRPGDLTGDGLDGVTRANTEE